MRRFVLVMVISTGFTLAGCKKSDSQSTADSSATPPAAQPVAPTAASPAAAAQAAPQKPAGAAPQAAQQPSSDADAAKSAAASGKWDAALTSARLALWKQPDNKAMADLVSEAAYQQAIRLGQAALTAGDLDAALDNAQVAVAHKSNSGEATDLLRKARQAFGDAHLYLGKHLTADTFDPRCGGIIGVYPAPDGKTLVVISPYKAALVNPETKSLRTFDSPGFYSTATSALVLSLANGVGRVDMAGKTVWQAPGLSPLGFSPDGKEFAACDANEITVLDAENGQRISKISTPREVAAVNWWAGFSSDGKLGAFATPDGKWTIFDTAKGAVVHTCEGRRGYDAAFGGANRFASSTDIEVSVLDTGTWKSVTTIETAGSCDFGQDAKRVIVSGNSDISLYDAATGEKVAGPIEKAGGAGRGYSLSADRSLLFAFSVLPGSRSRIEAHRVADGKSIGKFETPMGNASITLCTVLPDRRIAVGYLTGIISLLTPSKFADGTAINTLPPHAVEGVVNFGAFSHEGAAKADAAIASLKRTYAIDVIFKFSRQDLPVPRDLAGIDGLAAAANPTDLHAELMRYLHDCELTDGTPGFYIVLVGGRSASAWDWYPGTAVSLLSADDARKAGAVLDTLRTDGQQATRLRQFLAVVERKLQQEHPEIKASAAAAP